MLALKQLAALGIGREEPLDEPAAAQGQVDPAGPQRTKFVFADGHVYRGEIVNGVLTGRGALTWIDGVVYDGNFADNAISGSGTYTWRDGSTYSGNVTQALRDGQGAYTHGPTGGTYEGGWRSGRLHGRGRLSYSGSEAGNVYDGDWADGKRHGTGVMRYATGGVYRGEWSAGKRHGQGEMVWSGGDREYRGSWRSDLPDGRGTHVWRVALSPSNPFCSTHRYEGEWRAGLRHGRGLLEYASGAVYDGQWVDGKKHGHGVLVTETGRIYDGQWADDRPSGSFARADNDCPYHFSLVSLVPPGSNLHLHSRSINIVLSRYLEKLQRVFRRYAGVSKLLLRPLVDPRCPDDRVLCQWQLWELVADSGILRRASAGETLATTDRRTLAHLPAALPRRAALLANPHDQDRRVWFYDFCAFLVHLAQHAFAETNETAAGHFEVGLGAHFTHLLSNHICTDAIMGPSESDAVEADMDEPPRVAMGRYATLCAMLCDAMRLYQIIPAFQRTSKGLVDGEALAAVPPVVAAPQPLTAAAPAGKPAIVAAAGRPESAKQTLRGTGGTRPASAAGSGNATERPTTGTRRSTAVGPAPTVVPVPTVADPAPPVAVAAMPQAPTETLVLQPETWAFVVRLFEQLAAEGLGTRLMQLYKRLARPSRRAQSDRRTLAAVDHTVTVRQIVLLLQECRLLETRGSLTLARVLQYFERTSPGFAADGQVNLDTELVSTEFVDAACAFMLFKAERKLLFVVQPLLAAPRSPQDPTESSPGTSGPRVTVEILLERNLDDMAEESVRNTWCMAKGQAFAVGGLGASAPGVAVGDASALAASSAGLGPALDSAASATVTADGALPPAPSTAPAVVAPSSAPMGMTSAPVGTGGPPRVPRMGDRSGSKSALSSWGTAAGTADAPASRQRAGAGAGGASGAAAAGSTASAAAAAAPSANKAAPKAKASAAGARAGTAAKDKPTTGDKVGKRGGLGAQGGGAGANAAQMSGRDADGLAVLANIDMGAVLDTAVPGASAPLVLNATRDRVADQMRTLVDVLSRHLSL